MTTVVKKLLNIIFKTERFLVKKEETDIEICQKNKKEKQNIKEKNIT